MNVAAVLTQLTCLLSHQLLRTDHPELARFRSSTLGRDRSLGESENVDEKQTEPTQASMNLIHAFESSTMV